jgi:hypothetical protein
VWQCNITTLLRSELSLRRSVLLADHCCVVTFLRASICRYTVLKGQWLIRFASLFGLAALSVRLEFFLELYRRSGERYDFFFYNFLVQYGCVGVLGLIALLHWPSVDSGCVTLSRFLGWL